jgi:hypothetical protein
METTKKPPERFLRSGSLPPANMEVLLLSAPGANRAVVIIVQAKLSRNLNVALQD